MATRGSSRVRGAIVVMAIALAPGVLAQGLPRLPDDSVLAGAGESPGKVTFSHRIHVNEQRPDCTTCHPVLFKILGGEARADGAAYHRAMDEGRRCGACHNGKAAFGLEGCPACHREE